MIVAQSCLTLRPHGLYILPGSSVQGILQARILEWVVFPFSRDLPTPGIKPRSPPLQVDSLPSEPPGKSRLPAHSRDTVVGMGWRVQFNDLPSLRLLLVLRLSV